MHTRDWIILHNKTASGLTNYQRVESLPLWHNFNRIIAVLILRFSFWLHSQAVGLYAGQADNGSKMLQRFFFFFFCLKGPVFLNMSAKKCYDSVMNMSLAVSMGVWGCELHLKILPFLVCSIKSYWYSEWSNG